MPVNYACDICQYATDRKSNYTRHMKTHQPNDVVEKYDGTECLYCRLTFCNKYVCRRHMEQRCKERPTARNVKDEAQIVKDEAQNVKDEAQNVKDPFKPQLLCMKCRKRFNKTSNLKRHMQICSGVDSMQCKKCMMVFPSRQAKSSHVKVCKGHKVLALASNSDQNYVTVTSTPVVNTTNNIQADKVQNAQVIYNNHIYINNYGSEDLSHITKEVLDTRLREVNGVGVAKLIIDTHFNPNKPENHNIRINNRKNKTMRVKQEDRWGIRANDDVLDVLMRRYTNMLAARSCEDDFPTSLEYASDYEQIKRDMQDVDKDVNTRKYYSIIHKILAAMEELETHYAYRTLPPVKKNTTEQ